MFSGRELCRGSFAEVLLLKTMRREFFLCFHYVTRSVLLFTLGLGLGACAGTQATDHQPHAVPSTASPHSDPASVAVATVVRTYPHDPYAFTQGFEYYGGYFYESTGIAG